MSNKFKVFIIVCAVVFLTGLTATITGFALNGEKDLIKIHPWNWHISQGSGISATVTLKGNNAKFNAMDLDLDFCSVEYKQGDQYRVDLTYDSKMKQPDMSIENGVLKVSSQDEHFISGDKDGLTMILEITVPKGSILQDATLNLDACQASIAMLDAKNLDLSMDIGELTAKRLTFDNAKFNLSLCDATIQMIGKAEDYSYDIHNGLGSVTLDGADVDKTSGNTSAPYHYQLDSDLGNVDITYQ